MESQQILLSQITPEQFQTMITASVKAALESREPIESNAPIDDYMTASEVRSTLKISQTTLYKWIHKGVIAVEYFNSKPRFKRSLVMRKQNNKNEKRS